MRAGVEQVDGGVALAGDAGQCIAEMQAGSARVGKAVTAISEGLRDQSAASETVKHNVDEIMQHAERNRESAQGAAETAERMSDIASSTLESVNRFRIVKLNTDEGGDSQVLL